MEKTSAGGQGRYCQESPWTRETNRSLDSLADHANHAQLAKSDVHSYPDRLKGRTLFKKLPGGGDGLPHPKKRKTLFFVIFFLKSPKSTYFWSYFL